MKNQRIIYFCEGDCEQKLVDTLKGNKVIISGRSKIFNLWDINSRKFIRLVGKGDLVVVVFDTDKTLNSARFIENIIAIKASIKTGKIILLAQHNNFEDELVFSCNKKNKIELFRDFYRIKSQRSFKRKVIRDNALLQKLTDNGFNIDLYGSRKSIYSSHLSELKDRQGIDFSISVLVIKNS